MQIVTTRLDPQGSIFLAEIDIALIWTPSLPILELGVELGVETGGGRGVQKYRIRLRKKR